MGSAVLRNRLQLDPFHAWGKHWGSLAARRPFLAAVASLLTAVFFSAVPFLICDGDDLIHLDSGTNKFIVRGNLIANRASALQAAERAHYQTNLGPTRAYRDSTASNVSAKDEKPQIAKDWQEWHPRLVIYYDRGDVSEPAKGAAGALAPDFLREALSIEEQIRIRLGLPPGACAKPKANTNGSKPPLEVETATVAQVLTILPFLVCGRGPRPPCFHRISQGIADSKTDADSDESIMNRISKLAECSAFDETHRDAREQMEDWNWQQKVPDKSKVFSKDAVGDQVMDLFSKQIQAWRHTAIWHMGKDFNHCSLASRALRTELVVTDADTKSWEWLAELGTENVQLVVQGRFDRNSVLLGDTKNALLVVCSIFILTCVCTGSAFIALCSFIVQLLAFPISFSIYRTILGIRWMGVLNFVSVFVVLGVGADDTFVLCSFWKQSALAAQIEAEFAADEDAGGEDSEEEVKLLRRSIHTVGRASKAMFATSFTTAAAFFANAISAIPPMRLFGLFSGMMVLADYALSVSFLPACLVLQHNWWTFLSKLRLRCRSSHGWCAWVERTEDLLSNITRARTSLRLCLPKHSEGRLHKWFMQQFVSRMAKYGGLVVLLSCLLLSLAIAPALRIEPMRQKPDMLPAWHNQGHLDRLRRAHFAGEKHGGEPVPVAIVFGVAAEDTGYHLDPGSKGDVVWDESFEMRSPQAQSHILDFCNSLASRSDLVRQVPVCWIYDFVDFVERQYGLGSFPVAEDHFVADLDAFIEEKPSHKQHMFFNDSWRDGAIHRTLRGFRLVALSTMDFQWAVRDMDAKRLDAELRRWDEFVSARNAEASVGVSQSWHTSPAWISLSTIENLVSSGQQSILMSLLLALIVSSVSTGKEPRLPIFAVFTMACIVLSILALMSLGGYQVGVLESICLSILVGLAVDYTLHLALAYFEAPEGLKTREARAAYACSTVGEAVLAGAATTAVAGAWMLPTVILFFRLFGLFLIMTVVLSLLMALLLFTGLLFTLGPERRVVQETLAWGGRDVHPTLEMAGAVMEADDYVAQQTDDEGEVGSAFVSSKQHSSLDDLVEIMPVGNLGGMQRKSGRLQTTMSIVGICSVLASSLYQLQPMLTRGKTTEATGMQCSADGAHWREQTNLTVSQSGDAVIQRHLSRTEHIQSHQERFSRFHMDFRFPGREATGTSLPAAETTYLCAGFDLRTGHICRHGNDANPMGMASVEDTGEFAEQNGCTRYVTAFEALNGAPGILHHMVLFKDFEAHPGCPSSCKKHMPRTLGLLYGWAVGAPSFVLPPGVGMELAGSSDTLAVRMQLHFHNPRELQNLTDVGSGVRLHYTLQHPQHIMEMLTVGFPIHSHHKLIIPPGLANHTVSMQCQPRLRGEVRAFAYSLHSHLLGRRLRMDVIRRRGQGEEVDNIGREDSYNFNFQHFAPLTEETRIQPGDILRMTCEYDSRSRHSTTYAGEGTMNEMCLGFLAVYPKDRLAQAWCLKE